jgi:hypothetical protein
MKTKTSRSAWVALHAIYVLEGLSRRGDAIERRIKLKRPSYQAYVRALRARLNTKLLASYDSVPWHVCDNTCPLRASRMTDEEWDVFERMELRREEKYLEDFRPQRRNMGRLSW